MKYFARIIMDRQENIKLDESIFPKQKSYETAQQVSIIEILLPRELSETESDEYAQKLSNYLFEQGFNDFDIEIASSESAYIEETYEGNEFFENYGVMWFNEDQLDEAEYQGRKVSLGKPVRSANGPKKFHVFVKNAKGNVVKVNFGDPNMKIKKSIPARRRSFRARHNCDNPGPRTSARYWSCRAW
jgi:GrpB-like predicted nucleotidyltransferase (UPF0157 family)